MEKLEMGLMVISLLVFNIEWLALFLLIIIKKGKDDGC